LSLHSPRKIIHLLYFVFGIPVILGIIYVVCTLLFSFPTYASWSQLHLFFVVLLEPLLLIFLFDKWTQAKNKKINPTPWVSILIFFIINTLALIALSKYYNNPGRAQYDSVKVLLGIEPFLWAVLAIGILFCLVIIFGKRIAHFWNTFSFTSNSIMDRLSNKKTIFFLGGFFILGLTLRLINLNQFPPYADEYIHTHNAFGVFSGLPVVWNRAFLPVTFPVIISYKLFGVSLWAARFPMVLFNMLAILPLYFLGKKINKLIGFISVFLFVFNPWIIAASRTVREYAVIPLYFFLSALLLLDLLEWEGFYWKCYLVKNSWRFLILIIIAAYAVYDNLSILKILILNYAVFGGILILKIIKIRTSIKLRIIGSIISLVGIILLVIKSRIIERVSNYLQGVSEPALRYWNLLTTSNINHWFSLIPAIAYIILLVACFFALRAILQKVDQPEIVIGYSFLMFVGLLLFLTFFLVTPKLPARVRYGVLLEFWYLPLTALFFFIVFRILQSFVKGTKTGQIASFILLATLFINFRSIDKILNYTGGGALSVSGEKHYMVEPAYRFVLPELNNGDLLLTDYLGSYDELFDRKFLEVNKVSFLKSVIRAKVSWTDWVRKNQEGWIVLTPNSRIEKNGLAFKDVSVDDKIVYYIGRFGECYVWHWKKSN
jgi:hypothetical protein